MEFLGMDIDRSTLLYRYIIAGGVMMTALVPLSIFALGYIIQAFIRLRRAKIAPEGIVSSAQGIASVEEFEQFRAELEKGDSALARMAFGCVRAAERGELVLIDENPAAVEHELDRLYHGLTPLVVVYTIAPLIGLLGTILGLMNTFYQYAVVRQQDLEVLSVGINEALVTTMWGLYIAIPTYVFTALIRGKIFHYEKNIFPHALDKIMSVCNAFMKSKSDVAELAQKEK